MKRLSKYLLKGIGGVVRLIALGAWLASSSSVPVEGGELADGNVVIATDESAGPPTQFRRGGRFGRRGQRQRWRGRLVDRRAARTNRAGRQKRL